MTVHRDDHNSTFYQIGKKKLGELLKYVSWIVVYNMLDSILSIIHN
jgi:hypothetical protein